MQLNDVRRNWHGPDVLPATTVLVVLVIHGLAHAADDPKTPFTSEAQVRGLSYVPTQVQNHGQGTAFVDLDGDGDADLVTLGDGAGLVGIFENDGTGYFIDRSAHSGIGAVTLSSGVVAGDYDRDGDLDLYISRWSAPDMLFRNDGLFQFTDCSAEAGIGDMGKGTGCAWGDYDNDGWLDLYVANWSGPNRLYHNLGGGVFEEVARILGVDGGNEPTFQAVFVDFDRDGDADIYLATDRGSLCQILQFRNHLFENQGGTFIEITDRSGTEACIDAMCIAVGDFDGNGWQDFYCTNTPPGNALLLNQGDGTFLEQAAEFGVAVFATGWGSVFFDFDNDRNLDLYVCNTFVENRLFRHEGKLPSTDVAALMAVDTTGSSYTLATADIDDDGDLDLLLQNRGENLFLFVNHEGEKRSWAKFDVIGEGPNRYAVGANIRVRTDHVWQIREVIAGHNFKGQNTLVQHFGLNDALTLDEIQIMWPGGLTRSLKGLSANRTWTLYPPDKLGDGDFDGDRDLDDFFLFAACLTGHAPGILEPGCEMMDFQGDADVDLADFDEFLLVYEGALDDCDGNGVIDLIQILDGTGEDTNRNGRLDSCEVVIGDLNGDLIVDVLDLLILLGEWGQSSSPADLNGDNTVDWLDLLILLANWS